MNEVRKIFFEAVEAERKRQDQQYGGRSHDIMHTPSDWAVFIAYQASKSAYCRVTLSGFEFQMIKVAALALAAFEAGRQP